MIVEKLAFITGANRGIGFETAKKVSPIRNQSNFRF